MITFDDIKQDGRLWAVHFSHEKLNELDKVFTHWLRIYAIKLNPGIYVVTGGAIKLTRTMQEREHTLNELVKMEKVRQYLVDNNVIDDDSFTEFINEKG